MICRLLSHSVTLNDVPNPDFKGMPLFTSDKGRGKCVFPRLSVCLLARLLKKRAWIWI